MQKSIALIIYPPSSQSPSSNPTQENPTEKSPLSLLAKETQVSAIQHVNRQKENSNTMGALDTSDVPSSQLDNGEVLVPSILAKITDYSGDYCPEKSLLREI